VHRRLRSRERSDLRPPGPTCSALLVDSDGAICAGRGHRHRRLQPVTVHLLEIRVQGRLRPVPRRAGAVPPLRLLRVPLGVKVPYLPQAQGPR
jgi:hypothetical protein